jgi:ribonucleoside-triphosphate reductase (formate)
MFEDSSTSAAIGRVKGCLNYSLKAKYNIMDSTIDNAILKIHGIAKENFDFITNMEELLSSNMADISIDANANKNEITIPGLHNETSAPLGKMIGYRFLYRKLCSMYGKKEGKRLMGELYDYSLAIADSTKILSPYCFSLDTTKLVMNGRDFGNVKSAPPKRLSSYISALNETIHQLSNHTAGALAIGSFFFDIAHILFYRENMDYEDLDFNRDYITNCLQSLVHSVNHLSRNAAESPFTNISVFDRTKLETFLAADNMGWLFMDTKHVDGDFKEYMVKYITKLQDFFLDFMDKGDPLSDGKSYRFPVVTANISKHISNGTVTLTDKQFIKSISEREIYRYNVLVSEGSKVASCCRLLNNFELLELGGQMNSFGGAGISLGSHRVVTINFNRIALEATSYEHYKEILKTRIQDASKVLEAHRELMKDVTKYGAQPFMKNGWLRLDRMFSTFGVLGIVEANATCQSKFNINDDVVKDSLVLLNDMAREITIATGNIYNIEQIPGESMAPKLAKVDRLLFGDEAVPYELYSNQFVPLWENVDLYERMKIDGKYNQLFSGGGIVHFNLGEKLTPAQAEAIICYAAEVGCEHFALNPVYSECEKGHVSFGKHTQCPVCVGGIVEYYTRVVGFLVPVTHFNKTRREWEFPKRKFTTV